MQLKKIKDLINSSVLTADQIDIGLEMNALFWEPITADVIDISVELQVLFRDRDDEMAALFAHLRLDSASPAKNQAPSKEELDRVKKILFFN